MRVTGWLSRPLKQGGPGQALALSVEGAHQARLRLLAAPLGLGGDAHKGWSPQGREAGGQAPPHTVIGPARVCFS